LNRFNSNDNVIKRTYRNRFNKFDDELIVIIKEQNFSNIKIHDMAISDGRASFYFLNKVLNSFTDPVYHASDLSVIYNIYLLNTNRYIITDENRNIIEITRSPFVWNYARPESSLYFLNNFIKHQYRKKYQKLLNSGELISAKKLYLVDKEFLDIISSNNKFQIFNSNLFNKSNSSYNVIRAMNILHYGYFNDRQLKKILFNIHNSLPDGGLFIEGSNESAGSDV